MYVVYDKGHVQHQLNGFKMLIFFSYNSDRMVYNINSYILNDTNNVTFL